MTTLFLLTKRKSRKNWQINNIKSGISKSKVKSIISSTKKPGFSAKVLSEKELAGFLIRNKPKSSKKRSIKRKK